MLVFRCLRFQRSIVLLIMTFCGLMLFSVFAMTLSLFAVMPPSDSRVLVMSADTLGDKVHHPPDTQVLSRHNRVLQTSNARETIAVHGKLSSEKRLFNRDANFQREGNKVAVTGDNTIYVDEENDNTESWRSDDDEYDSEGSLQEDERRGRREDPESPGLPRIQENATKKLPEAIIIGVKKGGTRALLEFLRIHPDVRAPGPEPHFFDRHYNRGLHWYRKQMPSTIDGQITVEKTPSYFVTREVPKRIFSMSKGVKLIVVVRDPVTRAISDYTQSFTKRPYLKPFEQMAFIDNTTRLVDTKWGAVRIGVYAKHLERWLKYFPLRQMHFVSGERLISDPAGEMAKVQDFLGLKRIITDKHFYLNETRGFPCLKKPEGSGRPHCLGKTKGRRHPVVDGHVLQRLRDFYRPFNLKFYQMVGQTFGWT